MLFVFDTNTLISAILKPSSIPAQALDLARGKGQLIFSEETKLELLTVTAKLKFEKYLPLKDRLEKAEQIISKAVTKEIDLDSTIFCKDLSDIKFLNLAFKTNANCIVSGDSHLKELHPFRGISVWSPKDFLQWHFLQLLK